MDVHFLSSIFKSLTIGEDIMLHAINYLSPFGPISFFHRQNGERANPLNQVHNFQELTRFLTIEEADIAQWIVRKKEIKTFMKEHANDLNGLDQFLKTMMEWGIERDPQKTVDFLVDILELETLNDIARFKANDPNFPFENIFEWADEQRPLCPLPAAHSFRFRVYQEWKKCRPVVLYFIPNLINLFLDSFKLLDCHRKYTTLWDKYLLLEIVCKFFLIPFCLVKLLQPFFLVTAKVYVVAALVMVSLGILAACYQRWFRRLPGEIVNCTNLDRQMELGIIDPKVGQAEELERFIAALLAGSNVLLVGRSGEGKTALVHHFIQRKQEGKLPEELQKLVNYEIDCGLMLSNVSFGHSELINQTKDQINGHEKELLIFLDEFYQLASNKTAFQAFKKRFLEDKPHSKFVASITFKELEEIKKLDIDGSFMRRVNPIIIQSSTDEQNRLVLLELINRIGKGIPIKDQAIEKVLELSKSEEYLPGIGRPAKAIAILTDTIGRCKASYDPHYVSKELSKAREEYEGLKMQAIHDLKPDQATLLKIRQVRQKITEFEQKEDQNKQKVQRVKRLVVKQEELKENYFKLTHLIAQAKDQPDNQVQKIVGKEAQKLYLLYYFYGIEAMKSMLQREIDGVRLSREVQVDENLVSAVFNNLKAVEENLNEDEEIVGPEEVVLNHLVIVEEKLNEERKDVEEEELI